jgi:hypothetical protein
VEFGFEAADLDPTFLVVLAWILLAVMVGLWYLARRSSKDTTTSEE